MKSRTIEIIDNHIKALEEELEWYQEKNREWQEKCEKSDEEFNRWHKAYIIDTEYLTNKLAKCRDENAHLKQVAANHHNNWMKSQQELARLREQLRWHSVSELPMTELDISWVSVNVVLQKPMCLKIVAWYDFNNHSWRTVHNERITVSSDSKWCYIPDDNQGTDCTQEGE